MSNVIEAAFRKIDGRAEVSSSARVPAAYHGAGLLHPGRWLLLPRPWLNVDDSMVLCDQAVRTADGRPHRCQFLHRLGRDGAAAQSVFVKGTIQREEKETIYLAYWHQVVICG